MVKNPVFKKGQAPTGLAAVARPYAATEFRLGRKGGKVGCIFPPNKISGERNWRVGVMVQKESTKEEPAPWRWVFFKTQHDSEKAARGWIQQWWSTITMKYALYEIKD